MGDLAAFLEHLPSTGKERGISLYKIKLRKKGAEYYVRKNEKHRSRRIRSRRGRLGSGDNLESMGADSLDLMDMVMSFEDEFGVESDTEAIGGLKTIGDVVVYIEGLQK